MVLNLSMYTPTLTDGSGYSALKENNLNRLQVLDLRFIEECRVRKNRDRIQNNTITTAVKNES